MTIVTSDLKGSTSLGEQLDPESLREVLTVYFDEMRAVLEAHGGTIEKIIGDAIVAVFGLPEARDDDALRAVRAAAGTQRALAALNERLDRTWGVRLVNRTGVATGELVVGAASAGEHILTGDVLRLATRLEQSAPAQEILVGEPTHRLVAEQVTVERVDDVVPAGASQPVPAYRLVGVVADAETAAAAGPDATVGSGAIRVAETRKTVTIVFSDLKVTAADGDPLPAEALRGVMARVFDHARRSLERHGGTVEKFIGDAVMAVFGLPVRHEDDGLRATRAALDLRDGLARLAETLLRDESVRLVVATGVNTGEVVAGDASLGQRLVTGDAVNVAARLEQAAPTYEVYLGGLTYGLVRDAVEVEEVEPLTLKGKAEPVAAYRLIAIHSDQGSRRRQDTPMVGREAEMRLLASAFDDAVAERGCRMVTVVGEAGVGKTRLTSEFIDAVTSRSRVLRGRCLPYGDGVTFWPIAEVVRQAAGIRDDDPPELATRRIASLLGEGGEPVVEPVASAIGLIPTAFQLPELFWGIRRFFELLAADGPVVVMVDDIHWAEPTLLDLISTLVDSLAGAPVLLLCTSRHALIDREPGWATRDREARIVLQPLTQVHAELVVDNLLGQAGLDHAVRDRVVQAAEGNPLFVEQLLSMLVDSGSLRREDGRWVAATDLSRLAIPPTIHALLAARLDQLPGPERAVLEPASVIGLNFAPAAVRELAPDGLRDELPVHLAALERRQLVREGESRSEVDPSYRFQHILIRDAAYQGLLKRSRAVLHERFVDWADRVNAEAGRAQEFEEILGYHLEQAFRYRSDLGPLDEAGIVLGIRASERLGSAGHRAFGRGDMPAAANLLERAATLLPEDHEARPELLLRLGEARMEMGDYEAANTWLDAAVQTAAARGSEGLETSARLTRLLFRHLTDPALVEGDVEAQVRQAIDLLERAGDQAGLVTAWRFITNLRIAAAQWAETEDAVERVLHHAQLAGDRVAEQRAGPILAMASLFGPMPVPDAIDRCRELLERSGESRKAQASIVRDLAYLQAMAGDFEAARAGYRQARASLEELGLTNQASITSLDSGPIELLAGNPAAAEAELRRDYETLDRLGERYFISTVAAMLSDALYRQGRYPDADAFATFSEDVAAPDDNVTQILWRSVRARLLARDGGTAGALEQANAAVALTRLSDDLTAQAQALLDLAEVQHLAGQRDAAIEAATASAALCRRKENVVGAAHADAIVAALRAGAGDPFLPEAPDAVPA